MDSTGFQNELENSLSRLFRCSFAKIAPRIFLLSPCGLGSEDSGAEFRGLEAGLRGLGPGLRGLAPGLRGFGFGLQGFGAGLRHLWVGLRGLDAEDGLGFEDWTLKVGWASRIGC